MNAFKEYACVHVCTYTHNYIAVCIYIHTHIYTIMHRYTYPCIHTHAHLRHIDEHTCTHTYTHTQIHTHTQTHTYKHTHTYTHTHANTHTQTRAYKHTLFIYLARHIASCSQLQAIKYTCCGFYSYFFLWNSHSCKIKLRTKLQINVAIVSAHTIKAEWNK